ncbi:hypothetical protein N9271_01850 [Pseudomonadales bacterium]|nr:hypothetical protein [Pseudomonadales bacterium]
MSGLVVENLRLKELLVVVELNKPFFEEFLAFIEGHGYANIRALIAESDEAQLEKVLNAYFSSDFENTLFDGIGRPYPDATSKWFFITWVLRDAATQRLAPIVSKTTGRNITEKRIKVICKILAFVEPLLPDEEQWEWPAIAEIMLQRLEGSRRALKGGLFEAIVRDKLKSLFKKHNLKIEVTNKEVKLNDETYDIELIGDNQKILMPVKTRETMGGGHALLFTRDIHKAIAVAEENGFNCIPVVIAESWGGNLDELNCDNYIYIQENPNQLDKINPKLEKELEALVSTFAEIE